MTHTEITLGSIVRFDRPRARRRYVVCGIDQFGRLSLTALDGSVRGSSAPSIDRSELRLDARQEIVFSGPLASKLRSNAAFNLELFDHVGPKPVMYRGGDLAEPILVAWEAGNRPELPCRPLYTGPTVL